MSSSCSDQDSGDCGGLKSDRETGNDVGCRSGFRGVGDLLHGPVVVVSVVERYPEEQHREHDTDEACEVEPYDALQEPVYGHIQEDSADNCCNVIPHIHGCHRVSAFLTFDRKNTYCENTDDTCQKAECTHHNGEEHAILTEDRKECNPKDHRTDIFSRGGFEEVCATTGTVTDVVSHKVCDNSGVTDIVFRNTGLDFTHKVCTDIGSFCIDTTAELGKEGNKRGTKAKADDNKRRDLRVCTKGVVQ